MNTIYTIRHNDLTFYFQTEAGTIKKYCGVSLEPDLTEVQEIVPFVIAIAGSNLGFFASTISVYAALPYECDLEEVNSYKNGFQLVYHHKKLDFLVFVNFDFATYGNAFSQSVEVKNLKAETLTILHLSSGVLYNIMPNIEDWYSKATKVHTCFQTWQGEAQWHENTFEELGVFPSSMHPNVATYHITSTGSFSTAHYYPSVILEDTKRKQFYACDLLPCGSFDIELGCKKGWCEKIGALYMEANCNDDKRLGYTIELQCGETYQANPVIFSINSGFNDLIRDLTYYKRENFKKLPQGKNHLPLIFNDYMNCLWANPSTEKLKPLIDKASSLGMECFTIDAGWFLNRESSTADLLGDWKSCSDRFEGGNVRSIISYIHSKGMIAGVWLEMEVAGEDSALYKTKPDSWFLCRKGKRVGGGSRVYLNFETPMVREYIKNVFRRLIDDGVGYVKNDYNDCYGYGDEKYGSNSLGVEKNQQAFRSLIDEILQENPTFIIENCNSGAMRSDYGTLQHFHLQSLTDQIDYKKIPSILAGSLMNIIPEQLGVWAYPCPCEFDDREQTTDFLRKKMATCFQDGNMTVFTMVSGLCGTLYLSGRIDLADAVNEKIIREALAVYRSQIDFINQSYPYVLEKQKKLNDLKGFFSIALTNFDQTKMLVYCWRYEADVNSHIIQLPKSIVSSKILFPQDRGCVLTMNEKNSLMVQLPYDFSACIIEVMLS